MGVFDQRIPVEDIDLTYQISFKGGASKILELMQRQGFISGTGDTVRVDLNDSERFTNIIAEYALFLKAVVIHVVRKSTPNFSDKDREKLEEAFPVVDELLESLITIPEYRTALLGRVDNYLYAIDNDQVCGYCAQNAIGLHNYKFVENVSRSDFPKCSFLFADFVYYIARTKTFATLNDIQRVKEMASNEDRAAAKSFMAYANAVVVDAECLVKQIHNDLNVAYAPEVYQKSFVANTSAPTDMPMASDMLARAGAVDPIKMRIDKAQSEEYAEKQRKAEAEEKARKQLSDAAQELTRIEKEIDGIRHQLSQINEDIAQLKFAFWGERKRHKQELEQIRTQLNTRLSALYRQRAQL